MDDSNGGDTPSRAELELDNCSTLTSGFDNEESLSISGAMVTPFAFLSWRVSYVADGEIDKTSLEPDQKYSSSGC